MSTYSFSSLSIYIYCKYVCEHTRELLTFLHSTVLTGQLFLPQHMRYEIQLLQSSGLKVICYLKNLNRLSVFSLVIILCHYLHFHCHSFFPITWPTFAFLIKYNLVNGKSQNLLSLGRMLLQSRITVLSLVSSYLYVWVKKCFTTCLNVLCKSYHTFTTGNSEFIKTALGL